MDPQVLQSLRQYDKLKKPALKDLCAERGIDKPAHSVSELITQLRDHDDGLSRRPFSEDDGSHIKNPAFVNIRAGPNIGQAFSAAVDKWHLQPPYDTSISENDWRNYFSFRENASEKINSYGPEQDVDPDIMRGVLARSRGRIWELASQHVPDGLSAVTNGLYILHFFVITEDGDDDDSPPRTVEVCTRWYSPLGTGNFVDLSYTYHNRIRYSSTERFSHLYARFGAAGDQTPGLDRRAMDKGDTFAVFKMQFSNMKNKEKRSPAPLKILKALEPHMFASNGAIPPHTLYRMILAAGTVLEHRERNDWVLNSGIRRFSDHPPQNNDGDYESNATDPDQLEENMEEQRKKRKKAERDFAGIMMPMKRREVPKGEFLKQMNLWLDEAIPILSDSEDANVESESEAEWEDLESSDEEDDSDSE